METPRSVPRSAGPGSSVLVVDDDRRVLELLEVAFTAHGYRVLTAADGEEALRRVSGDRPDLLVLDVRLPRRSGLEVCEALRRAPEDAHLPIILVSAMGETDARLRGLNAGADDYLAKPFSPKELIARVKRLLARTEEGREARRRMAELARDLTRAEDEVKRTHLDARQEHRLRELAFGLGRDLHRTLDVDELAQRFLLAVQSRIGLGVAALLVSHRATGRLVPCAVRGDSFDRIAGLELGLEGGIATILGGLGRPVWRRELERLPETAGEIPPLVSAGLVLLAPLRGPDGLEGVLLAEERRDGLDPPRGDMDLLAGLCEIAAVALQNAARCRAQLEGTFALLARERGASDGASAALRAEAAELIDHAARALVATPRTRALVAHGTRLGRWAEGAEGRAVLSGLAEADATGFAADLCRMLEWTPIPAAGFDPGPLEEERAALLRTLALDYADARGAGLGAEDALARAAAARGEALDPATRQALEAARREIQALARSAA